MSKFLAGVALVALSFIPGLAIINVSTAADSVSNNAVAWCAALGGSNITRSGLGGFYQCRKKLSEGYGLIDDIEVNILDSNRPVVPPVECEGGPEDE